MALTYDQISAITEKKFIPKLVDNIFESNPMLGRLKKREELQDGGTSVMVPLNYATVTSNGWYTASEALSTTDNDVMTAAEFNWKNIYANITVSRTDELKNSGDAQKINFVKSKVKIAEKTISDSMGTGIFSAGTDAKSIVGARVFCATTSTYGGISQSTYSWWASNVDTSTTLTISALQGLYGDCTVGDESPSVVVMTQDNFDRYYALLQPQQRFAGQDGKGGFTGLKFNSADVIVDSHVPSGYVFMFNEDYLHWMPHKDENFRFEPFMKPINQNVKVAKIYWTGVLASSNNRMHGVMTSISA